MRHQRARLSSSAQTQPSATPRRRPRLVYAAEDTPGSQPRTAERPRILVVEDDFLVALQVETALTDAGFDLAGVASSAEEAIQLATAHRPALVLMDIRLSGKRDGIDAALELFRDLGIRCIFATAHQDRDAVRRAAPAKPLGWLPKPYTVASLLDSVRRGLHDLGSTP